MHTPCRITYSGGERVPQHELLACAQCGCFAFSCFEDVAIRVNMTAFRIGGGAGNAGELQGFAVGGAAVGVADDVDGMVRCHGIDELFAEYRRVPDIAKQRAVR